MFSCTRRLAMYFSAAVILAASPVQAQKPALTKSVDEPGRSPYFSEVNDSCLGNGCIIFFPPVPLGFRLVVTHAAVVFSASSTVGFRYAFLSGNNNNYLFLPALTPIGNNYFLVSTPVTYYVEPGVYPQVNVTGTTTGNAIATIVGYLVAIP